MSSLPDRHRGLDDFLFGTGRVCQAAVVEVLDRLTGNRKVIGADHGRNWFSWVVNAQLDLAEACLRGDLASLTDQQYATAVRLLSLHREFVQRAFDAVDTRDAAVCLATAARLAPVVHLNAIRSRLA